MVSQCATCAHWTHRTRHARCTRGSRCSCGTCRTRVTQNAKGRMNVRVVRASLVVRVDGRAAGCRCIHLYHEVGVDGYVRVWEQVRHVVLHIGRVIDAGATRCYTNLGLRTTRRAAIEAVGQRHLILVRHRRCRRKEVHVPDAARNEWRHIQ